MNKEAPEVKPDESLLLSDEEILRYIKSFYDKYSGKGFSSTEVGEIYETEYWNGLLKAQLAKAEPLIRQKVLREVMDWHRDEVKRLVTKMIDFCLDVQGEWASVEATYAPEWTYKYKDFIQELEQEFLGEGK